MKNIIRVVDKTTGGGTVLSGSVGMKFAGIGVTREGDPVLCPIPGHGRRVNAEGHLAYKYNGIQVAFDGHSCACGCVLISSLFAAGAS